MSKLFFRYGAMNSGKSTAMLQVAHNYEERDQRVVLIKSSVDTKGNDQIISRLGVTRTADVLLSPGQDLRAALRECGTESGRSIACVLVDEAQFLTREQVYQLGEVTDSLDIPVLTYGLRTDFRGEPFEGSKYLLAWSDNLRELKAICHCGAKATMVIRLDESGNPVKEGSQVEIGGNDRYVSLCRRHFKALLT